MAKNKGEKPKLNTVTYKILKGSLFRVEGHSICFCSKVNSTQEALNYIQQTNFDIATLEE